MEKEIIVESKKNDSYKLILKVELDEEDELLLKKRLNHLLAIDSATSSAILLLAAFGFLI